MKKKVIKSLICICLISLLCGCGVKAYEQIESEKFVMSTYLKQQVYGGKGEKAMTEVEEYFSKLEKRLSLFENGSDISRINQSAGVEPVKVSEEILEILSIALEYAKASDGAFDVTVAPLTLLWGIDTDNAAIPTAEEVSELLPLVDYKNVELDLEQGTVFLKKEGMQLDLGGIAKGYSSGGIFEIYKDNNILGGLCSIGGNIIVHGKKPNDALFTLGIRTPEPSPTEMLLGKLTITDSTVATAGGYERYLQKDDKLYHHILDTKTGYPSQTDILSVTVIMKDGARADALSTTLFLAGSEMVPKYINDTRFSVIVVDNQKMVYVSPAIAEMFTLTNSQYRRATGGDLDIK